MQKSELLQCLKDENQRWEALLDQIGPARMDEPGVNGDWSMKDMVAHLAGWNHWLVSRLQAAAHHQTEPPLPWPVNLQTEDEINAWIYASNRDHSVEQVLEKSRQALHHLFAIIESLPDGIRIEKIEPAFYLVWIGDQRFLAGEFFDHFKDDHEPDVHRWLTRGEEQ